MSEPIAINGHRLPDLLIWLLRTEQWQTPDKKTLLKVVPFLEGPLWLYDLSAITKWQDAYPTETDPDLAALFLAEEQERAQSLAQVWGSRVGHTVDLPWLDLDQTVYIAATTDSGSDQWVALDYRTGATNPRVVANDWSSHPCGWRDISPTFNRFIEALGLPTQPTETLTD